jgi:hypothetical protein
MFDEREHTYILNDYRSLLELASALQYLLLTKKTTYAAKRLLW